MDRADMNLEGGFALNLTPQVSSLMVNLGGDARLNRF
jgi:hypothetical protein